MDILIEKINRLNCPISVGLDSFLDYIPNHIKNKAKEKYGKTKKAASAAIIDFNKQIIDKIFDVVPAIKLQIAYYELFGFEGILALEETVSYAKKKDIYIIIDGKRNDIGSTAKAYSSAYLGKISLFGDEEFGLNCNSLTVNGYFGSDCLKVFLDDCIKYNKTIFTLLKTSNPSSFEIQNQKLKNGDYVFEHIGKLCEKLNQPTLGKFGYGKIGAVVGATHKEELKSLRKRFKNMFFLVPGFGAQGASAKDVSIAFKDGLGAIVNSSRAILSAWKKSGNHKNFAELARQEAIDMKNSILKEL